jgi:hypothetical protein
MIGFISLVQLPPQSRTESDGKPVALFESHYWSNRAYADYDELEEAAIDAWRAAVMNPDLMKTICNAPYLKRAVFN